MTIAVIAADGRTGRVFTELALAKGHAVRAGVHSKNPFKPHPMLTVIKTDATNPTEVKNLLHGCDVVTSFIGHGKHSPISVQTDAIQTIISNMDSTGQKRIISLTGTGVRVVGDTPSIVDRLLNIAIKIIDPNRVNDGIMHAEALQDSPLDYTIIRVLKLTNGKAKSFKLTAGGPAKLFTSRSEVANVALQVIEQHTFSKQSPIISKK